MRTPGSGHSDDSSVVPGHRGKYAHVERERRFLMAGWAELLGWLAGFGLEPGGDEAG